MWELLSYFESLTFCVVCLGFATYHQQSVIWLEFSLTPLEHLLDVLVLVVVIIEVVDQFLVWGVVYTGLFFRLVLVCLVEMSWKIVFVNFLDLEQLFICKVFPQVEAPLGQKRCSIVGMLLQKALLDLFMLLNRLVKAL